MSKLILIKHAAPKLDPGVPSARWVLSDEGRKRCQWLGDALRTEGVNRLYSSMEPKALETAALVAVALSLPMEPRDGLQENDRTGLGFPPEDELKRKIASFFARPGDVVMGHETAAAALARYSQALKAIVQLAHECHVAVVTHGTVLTLFVAHYNPIEPFSYWNGLTVPSYAVLESRTLTLVGTRTWPRT